METMDQIEENVKLLKLPFNKKLKIAIQTILTGQLKDNHDDTLFEKLCSLIQFEIENQIIQKFVIEENIFDLIDNNLPVVDGLSDVIEFKEKLMVLFRISGALFSHEEIFNLYQNRSGRIPKILHLAHNKFNNYISEEYYNETNLVNFSLYSFFNEITKHYSGTRWFLCTRFEANTPDENDTIAIEQFTKLLKSNITHYSKEKIYSVIANLIDTIHKLSSNERESFNSFLVNHVFNEFNNFTSEFIWNILNLILDGQSFIIEYKIIDLVLCHLQTTDLNSILIKLLSLIVNNFRQRLSDIENLINLTIKKLYSTNNCFIFVSFLSSTFDANYQIDGISSRKLWILFIGKFLRFVKTNYGIKFEDVDQLPPKVDELTVQTYNTISYCNFEVNFFKELVKIKVDILDYEDLMFLIAELRLISLNITNRKNITFILLFLDEVVKSKVEDSVVINQTALIYCDFIPRLKICQNLILKSIRTMMENCHLFNDELFLNSATQIIVNFNEHLKEIDLSNDSELLEMIVEIVYQLALHLNWDRLLLLQNDSKTVQQFCHNLSLNLDYLFSLIENDNLETYSRAFIISTSYLIDQNASQLMPNFKKLPFLGLAASFDNYDFTFKKCFLFNMKNILQINNRPNLLGSRMGLNELEFFCKNCAEENDSELQILFLNIINLICGEHLNAMSKDDHLKICRLFTMSGVFGLVFVLLCEPLVSYQVKLETIALIEKIRDCIFQQQKPADLFDLFDKIDFTTFTTKESFEFCFSPDVDYRQLAEKCLEHPKLNILDDIISTSLLSHDMVMDCY